MKVIVVGQRSFAVAAYKQIQTMGVEVAAVWTNEGDPLEELAHREGKPALISPEPEQIAASGVDFLVCAHLHAILSRRFLEATRGAFGYHPSLLPRHRGRDAVRWTIEMGDPIAGGTVYWLDEGVDTGPIIEQRWCHVRPDDDASSLWRRELFPMGVKMLGHVAHELNRWGTAPAVAQDEAVATYEPVWDSLGKGRPTEDDVELLRRTRGSGPPSPPDFFRPVS